MGEYTSHYITRHRVAVHFPGSCSLQLTDGKKNSTLFCPISDRNISDILLQNVTSTHPLCVWDEHKYTVHLKNGSKKGDLLWDEILHRTSNWRGEDYFLCYPGHRKYSNNAIFTKCFCPIFIFFAIVFFSFPVQLLAFPKKTGAPTSPRKRISQVETVAFDILFLFLYLVLIEHSSFCQETFQHFTPFRQWKYFSVFSVLPQISIVCASGNH